jgi:hypothetical protein
MRDLLEACSRRLGDAVDRFPWADVGAYADWLAQTYFYVRHSTRLLAAAAARFGHDDRGSALHARFAAHMGEEKRHELLCVHDLNALGEPLDRYPERAATRMFYEPQYYKIEHQTPIALFGYILPLEAVGPTHGKRLLEPVARAHGSRCVAFLKVHVAEDVEHLDKALGLLQGLGEPERALVEQNMEQTTYGYTGILDDIARRIAAPAGARRA